MSIKPPSSKLDTNTVGGYNYCLIIIIPNQGVLLKPIHIVVSDVLFKNIVKL